MQIDARRTFFPKRGVVERLEIEYQHIHIGLPQPFSVLHISDTHLTACDRFSPTAMQYIVGGNFMFHGEEVLFT